MPAFNAMRESLPVGDACVSYVLYGERGRIVKLDPEEESERVDETYLRNPS